MTQPIFDTLAFSKRLSAAGMETHQAEALADAPVGAFDTLATKADLREVELRLANTLTMRFGAMLTASTVVTVGILGTMGGS